MNSSLQVAQTYSWKEKVPILLTTYISVMCMSYICTESLYLLCSKQQHLNKLQISKEQQQIQLIIEFELYFNVLISLQALCNIPPSLLLGIFIDNRGYQIVIYIMALLVVLGQALLYLAYYLVFIPFLLLGRILLSLGLLNIHLLFGKILKKYFQPEGKFPLYNSLMVAFWILGSILNSLLSIYQNLKLSKQGPSLAIALGILKAEIIPLLLSVITALLFLLLLVMDNLNDKTVNTEQQFFIEPSSSSLGLACLKPLISENYLLFGCLMLTKGTFSVFAQIAPEFIYEFWGLYRHQKYYKQEQNDGDMMAIFWMVTLIVLIPSGIFLNKFASQKLNLLLTSSFIQLVGFSLFLFIKPIIDMPIFGISMSLRWAIFNPLLVEKFQSSYGQAYGITICFTEFTTFMLSIISGILRVKFDSYIYILFMIGLLQMLAIILLIIYLQTKSKDVGNK